MLVSVMRFTSAHLDERRRLLHDLDVVLCGSVALVGTSMFRTLALIFARWRTNTRSLLLFAGRMRFGAVRLFLRLLGCRLIKMMGDTDSVCRIELRVTQPVYVIV